MNILILGKMNLVLHLYRYQLERAIENTNALSVLNLVNLVHVEIEYSNHN